MTLTLFTCRLKEGHVSRNLLDATNFVDVSFIRRNIRNAIFKITSARMNPIVNM